MKRGYGQVRRPNGSKEMPVRSVRVPEEAWEKARRRANYEGLTMSNVIAQIVDGYAAGLLDLPKHVITYQPARRPLGADEPEEVTTP